MIGLRLMKEISDFRDMVMHINKTD